MILIWLEDTVTELRKTAGVDNAMSELRDDGDPRDERELWVSYMVTEDEVRQLQSVSTGIGPREACIALSNGYSFDDVLDAMKAGCRTRIEIVEWIRSR